MSRRPQDGNKTSALIIEEPPQKGSSRQLKFRRPADAGVDAVHLDTCQLFLDSFEPVALLLRKGTREVVACNEAAKEHGITLGSTCYQSWSNREKPCPWCRAPKMWKTGKTLRYQAEGNGRIWNTHWTSISDDLYLHYAHDITEQKQVEEALLASKTKLQGYIDNAPDGVLIVNGQGKIIEANPAACKITGYPEEELIQLSIPQILAPESQEDGGRHFAKVVDEGSAHGEFVGLCKDGSKIHYSVDAVKVSEDRFMGFIKDISVRKRAEKDLEKSELEYRSTVDNLPVGVVVHASDSSILICNPEASSILGLSVEQMRGKEAIDPEWCFVHEDASKMAVEDYPISKVIASGKPLHDYIVGIIKADRDHTTWVNVNAVPILTKERKLEKVIINFVDITHRKQAEERLKVHAHDLGKRVEELRGLYSLSQLTANPELPTEQVFQQASELIPPAWHYPELTCGRIVVNHKEYSTANYVESAWRQSAEILVSGVPVGMIEVAYLEEMPQLDEGPFLPEERDLIDAMAQILGQYIERHQNETRLRESNARSIEGQLALETKNIALSEVIEHVDREKKDTGFQIQSNIDRLVVPLLAKLDANANEAQKPFLSMLRSTLGEITSPFVTKLEKDSTSLTPREVEICNLIRSGLASKDIAQSLHTSEATVRTQRKAIRKKLGLSKSRTNLANYLQQV